MNRTALTCTTIATLGLLGAAYLTAGPLTPPPGAPASTYKSLQEVEPRTPIASGSFIITQPGSYYLTNNITQSTAPGVTGIQVATSNVTIDLNGFTISGGQTGIELAGTISNITIKNGTIRNTSGSGIFASGSPSATKVVVSDVHMDGITDAAVFVGDRAVIDNVHVIAAAGSATSSGIRVGATSQVSRSSCQGFRFAGFELAAGSLIEASLAAGGTGTSPQGNGFILGTGAQAERCIARSNSGDGFFLEGAAVARDCTATGNTGAGFRIAANARIDGCHADANVNSGIAAIAGTANQVIERSSISGSSTAIRATGATRITIRHNAIRGVASNLGAGVTLAVGNDDAVITHNTFAFVGRAVETNAGFGIIANNTLNFSGGITNSAGAAPAASNFIGPLLSPAEAATATNPFANISQ